jgi:hypothetical protein
MNRYLMVCRLRWPALLLLTGVIALLVQADMITWGKAWPLYLILLGVLALAERAVLASDPPPPAYPYGSGFASQAAAYPSPAPPAPPSGSTGIVPVHSDLENRSENHHDESRADFRNGEEEGR